MPREKEIVQLPTLAQLRALSEAMSQARTTLSAIAGSLRVLVEREDDPIARDLLAKLQAEAERTLRLFERNN